MMTSTQLALVHSTSQAPGYCPLWIENHTRYLINNATDLKNLTTNHSDYNFILYKLYLLFKKH
jgi:hypothetical protein